jgi:hypothetical protein
MKAPEGIPGGIVTLRRVFAALSALALTGCFVDSRAKTYYESGAKTYYVSTNGRDERSGTSIEEAWRTLAPVNRMSFRPGDRVLLEGGATFSGSIELGADDCGTAAAPVVISSWGEGRATIHGGNGKAFEAHNCGGVELRNLRFQGSGLATNSASGVGFWTDLPGGVKLEHIRIDRVEIDGFGGVGLYIGSNGSGRSGYRDVRITRVDIHHNGRDGLFTWGEYTTVADAPYSHEDLYVGYSRFHHNPGRLNKNEGSGLYLKDVAGAMIEYCEAYENGATGGMPGGGGPVGIWVLQSRNVTIQFNESHHNHSAGAYDGAGFDLDGGATQALVQYNYSHDNDGPGYQVVGAAWGRPSRDNSIRYNISENDARKHHGAIAIWSDAARPVADTDFYNNTVFLGGEGGVSGVTQEGGPISRVRFFNNIFLVRGDRPLVVASNPTGLAFRGNAYHVSGGRFRVVWGGVTYDTLSRWRASGQERLDGSDVGHELDPELSDPGNGSTIGDPTSLPTIKAYELRPASPLIDAGLNPRVLFGVDPGRRDFFGNQIPQGNAYDVGAHERPMDVR